MPISVTLSQATNSIAASYYDRSVRFNLRNWPDGILGQAWQPSGLHRWFASNGGSESLVIGTLDNILQQGPPMPNDAAYSIQGLPGIYEYGGGGPVLGSTTGDGSLLQVVHVERHIKDQNGNVIYSWSQLALVRSTDARNWTWLGVFVQSSIAFDQRFDVGGGRIGVEITGGPLVYGAGDGYLYCIYREVVALPVGSTSYQTGYASLARAPYQQVFQSAHSLQVYPWQKLSYDANGNPLFNLPATGYSNGLTPAGAPLNGLPYKRTLSDNNLNFDWCDVIKYAGDTTAPTCYLMAFVPIVSTPSGQAPNDVYAATSYDLITWQLSATNPDGSPKPITNDNAGGPNYPAFDSYPSLHFDTPGYSRSGTGPINLYYPVTNTPPSNGGPPGFGLMYANIIHRILTLTGT